MTAAACAKPIAGTVLLGPDDDGAVARYVQDRDLRTLKYRGVEWLTRPAVTAAEIAIGGAVTVSCTEGVYTRVVAAVKR